MTPRRLLALDGVRGIAALVVVIMHVQPMIGGRLFDHGYLMVDLFFLMSGFVLSNAYGQKLGHGGQGLAFMRVRLIRLYPLAAAGWILGALVFAIIRPPGQAPPFDQNPVSFGLGLVFLPWLAGGLVAPFDGPAWSLQAEFWINALYGFVAPRLTDRRLAVIVIAAAAGLAVVTARAGGLDGGVANNEVARGAGPWSFAVGWLRIGFAFPMGILLHRLWSAGRSPRLTASKALAIVSLGLVAIAAAPLSMPPTYDLVAVVVAFPALVLLAANAEVRGRAAWFCAWSGRLSYPLYILHGPILVLTHGLEPKTLGASGQALAFTAAILVCIGLAAIADAGFDLPVRRRLTAWVQAAPRVPLK